jgi:hypothetical protein
MNIPVDFDKSIEVLFMFDVDKAKELPFILDVDKPNELSFIFDVDISELFKETGLVVNDSIEVFGLDETIDSVALRALSRAFIAFRYSFDDVCCCFDLFASS